MQITKEELKKMYYSMTNEELCEKLNVSHVTLSKYIKQANITPKGKGGGFASSKIKLTEK